MSKNILAAAATAVGLILIAGVTRSASAAMEPDTPPLTVMCFYNGTTCTYSENYGHWDECDTTYPHGDITTSSAKRICGRYNN